MPEQVARLIFAGGGTGGHLYPAIAIADRVQELLMERMRVDIRFVGTRRGIEYARRDSIGFPLELISIRGLARSLTPANLLVPFLMIGSLIKCWLMMKRLRPHVVVGTGGYVAWPVLRAAAWRGIPAVLQEQNSFPGITTRKLAPHVRRIYLGFEQARQYLKTETPIIVTGNPVRHEITRGDRHRAIASLGLSHDKKAILILGGSQGAHAVNQAILRSLTTGGLPDDVQLIWQTGERDYKDVAAQVEDQGFGLSLFPFADDMAAVYAAADFAVARAGALTLAELEACGLPALLIPYRFAAGDHQRKNAQAFVEADAAIVVNEEEFDTRDILTEAANIVRSDRLLQMQQAVRAMSAGRRPAVDVIAEDIINLIETTRKDSRHP
jgi:UDP-N-acetylglucosamine--N-acetylmuramyl-(pentapeptide) pyrophosphoryl-undecaprenol N-acetylglucosamine transferase